MDREVTLLLVQAENTASILIDPNVRLTPVERAKLAEGLRRRARVLRDKEEQERWAP